MVNVSEIIRNAEDMAKRPWKRKDYADATVLMKEPISIVVNVMEPNGEPIKKIATPLS